MHSIHGLPETFPLHSGSKEQVRTELLSLPAVPCKRVTPGDLKTSASAQTIPAAERSEVKKLLLLPEIFSGTLSTVPGGPEPAS